MASDLRRTLRDVAVVLVCFALAGVACAFLWHWWWAPAPEGFVAVQRPFFLPDDEFRSTGTYVAVAAPVGILLGVLLTWLLRSDPVAVVLAVLVGSAGAGALMMVVGHALGPESADAVARTLEDFEAVRADLSVEPGAAWLSFPLGAVSGAFFVLLGGTSSAYDE